MREPCLRFLIKVLVAEIWLFKNEDMSETVPQKAVFSLNFHYFANHLSLRSKHYSGPSRRFLASMCENENVLPQVRTWGKNAKFGQSEKVDFPDSD